MADAFRDTFTVASDTALSAHTPDTGNGWVISPAGGSDTLKADATDGACTYNGTLGDRFYKIDPALGSSAQEIEFAPNDDQAGMSDMMPCVRTTDFSNGIYWQWVGTGGLGERVRQIEAGTVSNLASFDGASVTAWIKLVATANDDIELWGGPDRSSYTKFGGTVSSFNNTETGCCIRTHGNTNNGRGDLLEFVANTLGGSTTHLGSAALTAAASVVASATVNFVAAATLAAAAALTPASSVAHTGDAALAGTATLTPTATVTRADGAAALAGAATLTSTATVAHTGDATLAGTATLAPTANVAYTGDAALAGAATLTAAVPSELFGVAGLSAEGSLTAAGEFIWALRPAAVSVFNGRAVSGATWADRSASAVNWTER